MKKIIKIICLSLVFTCFFWLPVSANESDQSNDEIAVPSFKTTVKNIETGEIVNVNLDEAYKITNLYSSKSALGGNVHTVEYESVIPLEYTKQIQTRASTSTIKEIHDVKSTLKINYVVSGENIKVTGVSGSWVGTSGTYSMLFSSKEMWLHDGAFWGAYLEKYPSSSSFSYSVNWGYVPNLPATDTGLGGVGARAFSSCYATVSGMSGGYIVETFVAA